MTTTITILGCGSSGGVPRIGNDWGACDPANTKNHRNRCSVLVKKANGQGAETNVLIDTSPDMRNQLNQANVGRLDGVLYTHPHADHIHGIDDLRAIAMMTRERVKVWADDDTAKVLLKRFSYCFETPKGSDYPPILTLNSILAGKEISIEGPGGGLDILPFTVHHGRIDALGFKVGNVAYTPDLNGVPEQSMSSLKDLDCWIVDALRLTPHPSHFSLSDTLNWLKKVNPTQALITNMHVDLDYDYVAANTPEHVAPCYDGMTITLGN